MCSCVASDRMDSRPSLRSASTMARSMSSRPADRPGLPGVVVGCEAMWITLAVYRCHFARKAHLPWTFGSFLVKLGVIARRYRRAAPGVPNVVRKDRKARGRGLRQRRIGRTAVHRDPAAVAGQGL